LVVVIIVDDNVPVERLVGEVYIDDGVVKLLPYCDTCEHIPSKDTVHVADKFIVFAVRVHWALRLNLYDLVSY